MTEGTLPVTFYPKRSSAVWLLLGCTAFVAVGVWLGISKGDWMGFLCAGFFGLGIPVAVIQLMPGSTFLRLDSTGITFASMFKEKSLPWAVFQEFFVVTMRQTGVKVHETVGFNFVPTYDRARAGRAVARFISHCEGALPNTYGMKAEELAHILNTRLREFSR
jgi:hypothetical protein